MNKSKAALLFLLPAALLAQQHQTGRNSRRLVVEKVNMARLHTLAGNTRPEANLRNDIGRVADNFAMEHMLLQLKRPADQEQAVRTLIDQLHDPKSPNFHKWVSAQEFGQKYGPSQADVNEVTAWLQSQGFTVNEVYPSGMVVDFSGTAGQVRSALRTEIHHLNVNGERHVANISDPQIPEALAPVVAGVVSLHDFKPRTLRKARPAFTIGGRSGSTQAVTPSDLATIYNLNGVFNAGYTGKGQTIAVVEDTNLYSTDDWNTFRSTFGLSQYSAGSLVTIHPGSAGRNGSCVDPGVVGGDDSEAALDAEWASAAAPDATIQLASCADTRSTMGLQIALQNLVNSATPPSIISLSYGLCEVYMGAGLNAAFNNIYQQAVAEGVSIFVASGDEGAAACDAGNTSASHGIGVSGFASTPYNVAVGGTDFADSASGSNSSYWSNSNSDTFGSALSYIPEVPWNESCSSGFIANYFGYSTVYGTDGFCGSSDAKKYGLLSTAAGSGGPSGCATGFSATDGVVNGTCQGWAKPSWQSGLPGIPNDNVRDIPDVSLFAASGFWGHYYVYCFSDFRNGGASCSSNPANWAGAGGTSFSAPIMAGIQALINQKTGSLQGNPNYEYYRLAGKQYNAGLDACNSSNGSGTDSGCTFYNVTQGDIAVNCAGDVNCFGNTAAASGRRAAVGNGAISTSSDSFTPAFSAGPGWNFATGIGTVNAFNLVMNWGQQ